MRFRIIENELGFFVDEWGASSYVFGDVWREMPPDWKPIEGPFNTLKEAESYITGRKRRIGAQPFFRVVKEIET